MRKPKFINRPDDVTLSGKPRKKHRSFNEKEIALLKKKMHIDWASRKEYGSIQWNFNIAFGWRPSILTLKSFYEKKTYLWAWEDMSSIPLEKKDSTCERNKFEEYEDLLKEGLKDPFYGSSEEHFMQFLKDFDVNLKVTKNLFNNLRRKFGGIYLRATKQESEKIVSYIKEHSNIGSYELYEKLCSKFKMTPQKYNYFCRKAELKQAITNKGYNNWILKKRVKTIVVNSVEVRYEVDGKFYIDKLEVPKKVIDNFVKKIAKSLA